MLYDISIFFCKSVYTKRCICIILQEDSLIKNFYKNFLNRGEAGTGEVNRFKQAVHWESRLPSIGDVDARSGMEERPYTHLFAGEPVYPGIRGRRVRGWRINQRIGSLASLILNTIRVVLRF